MLTYLELAQQLRQRPETLGEVMNALSDSYILLILEDFRDNGLRNTHEDATTQIFNLLDALHDVDSRIARPTNEESETIASLYLNPAAAAAAGGSKSRKKTRKQRTKHLRVK